MRLSRIDHHIKDEPCAKQRALLSVFSSRVSSVSRDIRSTYPFWVSSPLVSSLGHRENKPGNEVNTEACKYKFVELLIQIITTGFLIGTLIQLYEPNSKNTRVAERLTNTYG